MDAVPAQFEGISDIVLCVCVLCVCVLCVCVCCVLCVCVIAVIFVAEVVCVHVHENMCTYVKIFIHTCKLVSSVHLFPVSLQPAIPMTENLDVLSLLTDAAKIAQWCNENLPSDRMSIENATILTNAERWPLMIDPQLQGIKWIKTREGDGLKVVRLGTKG